MKILIYDNNQEDLSKLCEMLEALPMKFFIDKLSHYEDCIELYDKHNYEIVFIDFADDIGKKILSYILEKNPKQKVVTMSDVCECSEKRGCDFCMTRYDKKRVTKPIAENELFKILLRKEPCKSYCNDELLIKLEIISKGINYLSFNKEQFAFIKNGQNYHKEMSEVIKLSSALSETNIDFELIDNGIKILGKSV
jgi:hypothetical protein